MPIYEFVCRDCGTHFEHMQSFSATTLPPCPACSSHHVGRLLSRPAIHFKGSGWYITDSKNAGKGAATSGASAKPGEKVAEKTNGDAAPPPPGDAKPSTPPAD